MSVGLRVASAGPGVTLQDAGRHGYLRFGVTSAGPMDPLAFATANLAVGAPEGAACIEISTGGLELTAEAAAVPVAIAGGSFDVRLDGARLPSAAVAPLQPGSVLAIRPGPSGAWSYLAVGGRLLVGSVMGSVATHTRSGLGGRALRAGDFLPIAAAAPADRPPMEVEALHLERPGGVIRVVFGPQDDYFSSVQRDAFVSRIWSVSHRSDRMAYRLEG